MRIDLKMKKCNYCGAPLDDDSQFCANCGKKIELQGKKCSICGAEIENDAVFCSNCGTKFDSQVIPPMNTPQVVPTIPSQETAEEIVYEWEEEKDRKWLYVIGGIIVVALAALGWYYYSPNHEPQEVDNVELTPEKETSFVELIKKWDEMHNNKQFNDGSNCPYAETVYFYGTKMSRTKAAQTKQEAVEKTDYQQESTNIKITRISDKLVVCNFEKHTQSKGKSKVHPDCYLYFEDEGEGVWKIKEESDEITDNNLLNRASDSYDEITVPITLQFIRKYCDHLKLPYEYWTCVENEIKEQNLNISTYYESIFRDSYTLRGQIAMNYKYPKGNDILKKSSHFNYLNFCDAIGRIKEVWKVEPVRIESDNTESPLLQFRYEEDGARNVIITAQYILDGVEEMDDIPIYHYKYITDDNREVKFDMISY